MNSRADAHSRSASGQKSPATLQREERLAARLRENLHRRKAQSRAERDAETASDSHGEATDHDLHDQ